MVASVSAVRAVSGTPLSLNSSGAVASVPNSSFFGTSLKKVTSRLPNTKVSSGRFKIVAAEIDESKQTDKDKWRGLAYDTSDDQQDITRGKGMVDTVFQAPQDSGTHYAVMSSYEYISTGLRQYNLDNTMDGFYIAPAFMDKLVVHITKNFLTLPNIKVPLILGIWGGKGQGKSFQAELVFAKMGINPIMMSAGELESGNAGEPAKLIRQRYREASDIIRKGKMCCLFINDLDAGAGRMGGTTQYTVNNQMVNATLMNIADNPTNVQLPGMYNKEENARVPIIVTGNDFSTLYAPLIRDGRMEKFYWAPTREDRIGVCKGIFRHDNVPEEDVVKIVDTFPGQSIDFFGALRARVYDDEVRKWIAGVGIETIGKKLVNSKEGPPTFDQPKMSLEKLLEYGNMLVQEQENVKRVQLAPNNEVVSKESGHRRAFKLLEEEYNEKIARLEAQVKESLHEKASYEATISQLHGDIAAHKNHMQILANRLDQVHFEVESKYSSEIRDLKDCLMAEQEEKNDLNRKMQLLEKELLLFKAKMVDQQQEMTSNWQVETLKQKIMKLRKENEVLKRKFSHIEEGK